MAGTAYTATATDVRVGGIRIADTARGYLALTKPRIIGLLLVTTVPAMMLPAGGAPPAGRTTATLLGGALAAGCANTFNCYLDRDIDALMKRTQRRPLPSGQVSPPRALLFGIALGVAAMVIMATATTMLAAVLALLAILFYVVGYTMVLKRRTPQNIVWGGVSGAMPVLIGWAAVTGGLSLAAGVLFLIVFCWTPPHFWALALRLRPDYATANVPMLPVVVNAGRVAQRIVGYCWATVIASLALWPLATSWLYGAAAVALGATLLIEAHQLKLRVRHGAPARSQRLFTLSIAYLALLYGALAIDTLT